MSSPPPPSPPLLTRLGWVTQLYIIKALLRVYVAFGRLRPGPPLKRPSYIKRYPVRPNLVNHVWIPHTYKPGTSPPLPLFIDIHGGGFCIGHPMIDDGDNAILCHTHGICVVSINYRKAPGVKFPIPTQDVVALIEAVLDDPELPVDKTRVALGGYSAGGALSLTAPQLNGLIKRIKGVVAFYPATDLTRSLKTRLDSATSPPDRKDVLIKMVPMFNWAYIPRTQDRRDPLLSSFYAPRNTLPQKLYILGCEYDMLCKEAREMAEKLADAEIAGNNVLTKRELGDGRTGWQCGTVTWEELKGVEHGFNQRARAHSGAVADEWRRKTEEMHARVAEWLFREVYAD